MTQPEIPGTDVGRPVMPFGSDGSNWIALLIDALGRLQVDATIDNVPSDLATQTTLAVLTAAMGAIGGGDAGTLLAYLKDTLTRLNATKVTHQNITKYQRSGILASSGTWTELVNIPQHGVLEALDFSSNYQDTELKIKLDNVEFYLHTEDGASIIALSFLDLNDLGGQTAMWQQGIYDAGNDYYSLFLKAPFKHHTRLQVFIRQESGVDKNVSCIFYYRIIS